MYDKLPMYQNIGASAYKKDLSNIRLICDHLGNPQNNLKSIHVGGTNGKGSCSHMLSSVLQQSGYKVGLYTSPHLSDFRERIKINGKMISRDYVSKFMNKNFDFFQSNNLSFFEMTVGLAFYYFSDKKVDIAIIEVGMGGRLDSTNIINPLISVITNISIDHTKFLGSNISEIAIEKAGIIKNNTPVIIGETQQKIKSIFNDIASSKKSNIYFADKFKYQHFNCDLKGDYQKKNIKTVLKTIEILKNKFNISNNHIYNGLNNITRNTGLKGRWQVLKLDPTIICDTAHNEAAIKEVVIQLKKLNCSTLHFIIGFSDDKNIHEISKIFPKNSKYYFVKPNVNKGLESNKLKRIFESNNRFGESFKSVSQALNHIINFCDKKDVIFIGGSTFVVAEVV